MNKIRLVLGWSSDKVIYHITGPDWAPKVAKKFTRNKGGPNVSRIFMEKLLGGPMWAGGPNVGRFLFPHISSVVYSLLVL